MDGKFLILAIAAAFYPTLLAVVIFILTRPNPVRLLVAFLVGAMITSVSVGLGVIFVIKGTGAVGGSNHNLSPAIDVAAGLASLALAFILATGREQPLVERRRARRAARRAAKESGPDQKRDPWTTRLLARDSAPLAFGLGVILDLPSVWYLVALKDIAAAHHPTGVDVLLVVLFNLIMFLLIEVPLIFYVFAPERSEEAVARFNEWTRGHVRQIGIAVATIVGGYLLVNGILGLVN